MTAPSNTIDTWHDRFKLALDVLASPASFLRLPPDDGRPADRLRALASVRANLRIDEQTVFPGKEAGERMAARATGQDRRDDLADLIGDVATRLDEQLAVVLSSVPPADRQEWVVTADFRETRVLTFPWFMEASPITGDVQPVLLVAGVVNSLQEGHPHRQVLTEAEFYHLDREPSFPSTPALVLGRVQPYIGGGGMPRTFYTLESALWRTRQLRAVQRQEDAVRAEQQRDEARQRAQAFWSSPLGKLHQAQEALDELKKAGKIPEKAAEEQPAIRGAGAGLR